jgi:hypothetical protein
MYSALIEAHGSLGKYLCVGLLTVYLFNAGAIFRHDDLEAAAECVACLVDVFRG